MLSFIPRVYDTKTVFNHTAKYILTHLPLLGHDGAVSHDTR